RVAQCHQDVPGPMRRTAATVCYRNHMWGGADAQSDDAVRLDHQFYARYTLACPHHPDQSETGAGTRHEWWEPLLPTTANRRTGFNRTEYLRITPTTTTHHARLYGMRQDSESLNNQLERAFYGRRLPAWGVHNQTSIVLLAAVAENAWARHVFHTEAHRQHEYDPPDAA
ncbi:MAG: hypothetical protein M3130_05015, partial [Actinomycetota bacterium]|nr:hypothetical protein [Actinomycetota bacterium]